ncbi:glycosyltransferase family 4 protein [Methanothermococcus okinawensis]|uniref:Glycosyl transferase group 1 n=1 Tax=Methanothermococcus okinawensis (strain DSM 14208 / JCM 11175 / IH1) TaxID=647113 RepID=F8AJS6_METOI|nr:glycosyltransferase family 4 protein [Methanothermococcus okinawensis]AEH07274.1 glycosyl transferase group 1 [Methanothermococcus okinawensis IH1]
MKVYFISTFPTNGCGISEYSLNIINELKSQGINIISRKSNFLKSKNPFNLLIYFLEIILKKPDIVHIQYTPSSVGIFFPLFMILMKLFANSKVVITSHEKPESYLKHLDAPILKKLFLAYEKISLKFADIVLVHTDEHFEKLLKYYGLKNIQKIHFPIPTPQKTKDGIKHILKHYGLDNIPCDTILFLGAIRPNKGLEYLIDAAVILKNKGINYKIIVVGGIPKTSKNYFKELLGKINEYGLMDYFKILGYVPDKDLPAIFAISDIGVLPYTEITQSQTLHQMIAYKIPVVVTNVGGIKDIVKPNNIGIIVKKKDPGNLAEGIFTLLNNKNNILTFKKNLEKLNDAFSSKKIAEEHVSLYKKLLNEGK